MVENKAVVNALESGDSVVDFEQFVADLETHVLGRAANDDLSHRNSVVDNLESDAYTFEIGLQAFVGALHVFCRNIGAVRVEFGKHRGYGLLANLLVVGHFYIVFLYIFVNLLDAAKVRCVVVFLVLRYSYGASYQE